MSHSGEQLVVILFWLGLAALFFLRKKWAPSTWAHGAARWQTEASLKARGMLGPHGLVLARTNSGKLIRLPRYTHVLLVGGTGAGKGVSIIVPIALSYMRGSLIVFDCKGDLHSLTAERRRRSGQRIIRLAPFVPGGDTLNPLDSIPKDSPILMESARALAEALVVRTGMENDQHWSDRAVAVISGALTAVLMLFQGEERSLNSVASIVADPQLLQAIAIKLMELEGIPARMGSTINALFDPTTPGVLSKEGASILSSANRHLSFTDSASIANSVAKSTFQIADLCNPGATLYLQLPPDQLEAQKGWLRCIVSTLVREISRIGCDKGEVFFLLDEASALNGLSAVEEALVRGRSAGVRMLLAYQDESQVRAAFKDKPTLLFSNTDAQIWLGASTYETAERISKSLGDWTQTVSSYGENESRSYQSAMGGQSGGPQTSRGSSANWAVSGRNLLRPEEILTLSTDFLICFVRGMAPILARRIKWYADPDFNPTVKRPLGLLWWAFLAMACGLTAWAIMTWR